ncbi:MAG: glutathione S-transferase family protein [Nitratireductor sp.]|nr:glutathione S-transferase family protein [Nitratireductor sp.]
MKLHNANLSPNALRVRAVIFELGLDVEIVDVDLRGGGNKTPDYLAMNPNGKVPVLEDGDFVVWESRAINAYLASLNPEAGLYPDDARKRALIDQWSYWQAIHLGPAIQRIAFERLLKPMFGMGEADETVIEQQMKELAQLLPVLDAALAGKDWVCGDLSVADFALASVFVYRAPSRLSLDAYPNIAAWLARMEARPAWQKAVEPVLAFGKK